MQDHPHDHPRAPIFDGVGLLRVVLPPDYEPVEDIQLVSVELYEDGLIVRWNRLVEAEPSFPPLAVQDDVGTTYTPAGSGGFRTGYRVTHGQSCFVPAVPASAKRLDVNVNAARTVAFNLGPCLIGTEEADR